MHDFNGLEVNGIHGIYGKKGYDEALYSVNKRHDIAGIHEINGNFPYDDIFRKNHARLYFHVQFIFLRNALVIFFAVMSLSGEEGGRCAGHGQV